MLYFAYRRAGADADAAAHFRISSTASLHFRLINADYRQAPQMPNFLPLNRSAPSSVISPDGRAAPDF